MVTEMTSDLQGMMWGEPELPCLELCGEVEYGPNVEQLSISVDEALDTSYQVCCCNLAKGFVNNCDGVQVHMLAVSLTLPASQPFSGSGWRLIAG